MPNSYMSDADWNTGVALLCDEGFTMREAQESLHAIWSASQTWTPGDDVWKAFVCTGVEPRLPSGEFRGLAYIATALIRADLSIGSHEMWILLNQMFAANGARAAEVLIRRGAHPFQAVTV